MKYDVAMRHHQALDPSAINTIAAGLHNIEAAIKDARNAGKDAETDPAVILLCRHLAAVCDSRSSSSDLRRACMDEIAEIRRHPALIALAYRGVAYDLDAKRQFHADGRRAMRRLAEALSLPDGSFDVRSNQGGIAVSGEIILHGEEAWVELSLGCMGPDREVMFRRVRGRTDYIGDRNRFASVRELLSPDRFAARLRCELALTHEAATLGRLVA
ncbi:hypothetical protein [Sphingobium chungangianum]